ncbi:MAG: glycine cleavage system aminomethyltransferase GcvT [Bdellovibrionaceae bacterium]|nr:glycine cleavage system aminomethyltransferase GcvT [Pseudobdellovibrionaceae bacterium]MDW8189973.1 glycine cleavage system aminomethyltransferase GcvT [Pseudobdellovibrionaceae bacterium]
MSKQTPLYEEHVALKARMMEFAGYVMPIFYEGIRQEHLSVRQKVGVFDVSHMGEIRILGDQSLSFLEWITTNSVTRLQSGQAQYTLLLNHHGGVIDDAYLYCLERGKDYLLCVNASNSDKVESWLRQNQPTSGVDLISETHFWAQIAVQGPRAPQVISEVLQYDVSGLSKNRLIRGIFRGVPFIFATSGYTGERGGEIFIESGGASALWKALLSHPLKPTPCGLGARDSLRIEMGYPLYGNELSEEYSPWEAGLSWVVKLQEKDFIGKEALLRRYQGGDRNLTTQLIGFMVEGKAIARTGYSILNSQKEMIGRVTSGTLSPSLEKSIGLGFVAPPWTSVDSQILIKIRDHLVEARVVSLPFYQPKKE